MTLKKKIAVSATGVIILSCAVFGTLKYSENEYDKKINSINKQHKIELEKKEQEKDEIQKKYDELKEEIKLSKELEESYRYDFENKDLRTFEIYTVDEMNQWIDNRAPEDSPFKGEGEVFLEASAETGLDPKYLVAHAALESAWGESSIANDKNNYYGIGAYNSTPTSSAYTFEDSFESGIKEGAVWIKENYIEKGKNTLNKMNEGPDAYCTLDDEVTPDDSWVRKIVNIVY